MKLNIRRGLLDMYKEKGPQYGLSEEMFLQQFIRDTGLDLNAKTAMRLREMSSLDTAQMVISMLCQVPNTLSAGQIEGLPRKPDGSRDAQAVDRMEREELVANFWKARKAVLCRDPDFLAKGIQEAVEQAREIQRLARRIIDQKMISFNATKQFRFCKVEQAHHVFRHHLAVRRLAMWLLHVLFTYRPRIGQGHQEKALLVMVRDPVRDAYLCVGTSPSLRNMKNEFSDRFSKVMMDEGSLAYRYPAFDRSCFEIEVKDFDKFWASLSNCY
jgi:uncharacterized membrane protein